MSSFFCVGELQQSEALEEFSFVIFLKQIPLWQNIVFTLLKFFFVVDKKTEKKLCRSAINELISQKLAIRIMDDLIDNWPLSGSGKRHLS